MSVKSKKVCPKCRKTIQIEEVSYPSLTTKIIEVKVMQGCMFSYDVVKEIDKAIKVVCCPECGHNYQTDSLQVAWEQMVEENK